MYHLATAFPVARRVRLPLSRDQVMLLLVASTELGLAVETFLAHQISGTIVPNEWISIIFGVVAGVVLLVAGAISLRNRPLATLIATVVLTASIGVGLLGAFFHFRRAALLDAPAGAQVSINLFVWAPPILGPLTYAMAGLLGLSAAAVEDPPDSGRVLLPVLKSVQLPLSKTRAYFLIVGLGALATLISSVLDHARTNFSNTWLWVPIAVGTFGVVIAVLMGAVARPTRGELLIYIVAMLLLILVGVLGMVLHVLNDLTPEGVIVVERFIRGAPFLAPMLYTLMGTYGLAVLLDPNEPRG